MQRWKRWQPQALQAWAWSVTKCVGTGEVTMTLRVQAPTGG